MRKFALLTLEYPPDLGGIAEYLQGLWKALPPALAGDVVRVTLASRPLAWLTSLPRIWRDVSKRKPQGLVISHLLPMGYVALLFKILQGLPYAVIVHGTDLKRASLNGWKRFWAGRILGNASLVVANSAATRDMAIRTWSLDQSTIEVVCPCPSGPPPVSHVPRSLTPLLLSVARLVPRKGIANVIAILPKLRQSFPDIRYVVVGTGPEEATLKALAQEKAVAEIVEFTGPLDRAELEQRYDQASLFVLPGIESSDDVEGFGLVFIEAARHGLASVSGAAGGAPEAVLDRQTGLVVDANDDDALSSAIAELLRDPETARRYGEAARRRALTEFVWPRQAAGLVERLKTV